MVFSLLFSLTSFLPVVIAGDLLTPRAATCANTATTRGCWDATHNISTDFDQSWPTTGKTQSYTFILTNGTCNPDGQAPRDCLLINNKYPGPTITANWGDMISVTVKNHYQDNGTSLHWHGIRQLGTVGMDGVNGITECPIAPGGSKTYLFQATQYGTSWYHSHYTAQYVEGLHGAIQINGPASANYDVDLGPVVVSDWYYRTGFQIDALSLQALHNGGPGPNPDTILVNGNNKHANGNGAYTVLSVKPGQKARIRLINTSADNSIRVSIDKHTMQVITSDFVPIVPFTTDSVLLAVGQRYDVIITTSQPQGNYWLRATAEGACASTNAGSGLAVINYVGTSHSKLPTSTSTAVDNGCNPPGALTPYVSNQVGSAAEFIAQAKDLEVNLEIPGVTVNQGNLVTWGINTSAIQVQWDTPTLTYVMNGNTAAMPASENLIQISTKNKWIYWIIQESGGSKTIAAIPHPMHIHGHDFYVLGSGAGIFDLTKDPANLQYNNPTRRDTVMLPGGGWLALAFPADNPGAWLMHCHIAWHVAGGLGMQFMYPPSSIPLPAASQYNAQCAAWKKYYATSLYKQIDSGL